MLLRPVVPPAAGGPGMEGMEGVRVHDLVLKMSWLSRDEPDELLSPEKVANPLMGEAPLE